MKITGDVFFLLKQFSMRVSVRSYYLFEFSTQRVKSLLFNGNPERNEEIITIVNDVQPMLMIFLF